MMQRQQNCQQQERGRQQHLLTHLNLQQLTLPCHQMRRTRMFVHLCLVLLLLQVLRYCLYVLLHLCCCWVLPLLLLLHV
jgi:hypothetical protein